VEIAASTSDAMPQTPAPVAEPPSAPRTEPFERRKILSAAVDIASPEQIIAHLIESAENRRGRSVVGISAPYVTAMAVT